MSVETHIILDAVIVRAQPAAGARGYHVGCLHVPQLRLAVRTHLLRMQRGTPADQQFPDFRRRKGFEDPTEKPYIPFLPLVEMLTGVGDVQDVRPAL